MYYGVRTPYATESKFSKIRGLNTEMFTKEVVEGMDKIRLNIINLLETRKGARFFEPEIGSNLEDYLFELNDFVLYDSLKRAVTKAITENVVGIELDVVEIEQDPDSLWVKIYVRYLVIALGKYDEVVLYKERALEQV